MKWLLAFAIYLVILWLWRRVSLWIKSKAAPEVGGEPEHEVPPYRHDDIVDASFREVEGDDEETGDSTE